MPGGSRRLRYMWVTQRKHATVYIIYIVMFACPNVCFVCLPRHHKVVLSRRCITIFTKLLIRPAGDGFRVAPAYCAYMLAG